jgi:hypothetical protein
MPHCLSGLERTKNMVTGPDGTRNQNDCAGEGQQQITALLSSLLRLHG